MFLNLYSFVFLKIFLEVPPIGISNIRLLERNTGLSHYSSCGILVFLIQNSIITSLQTRINNIKNILKLF